VPAFEVEIESGGNFSPFECYTRFTIYKMITMTS